MIALGKTDGAVPLANVVRRSRLAAADVKHIAQAVKAEWWATVARG